MNYWQGKLEVYINVTAHMAEGGDYELISSVYPLHVMCLNYIHIASMPPYSLHDPFYTLCVCFHYLFDHTRFRKCK